MSDAPKVVAQLRALLLLTQTEVQIAETRVAQASTDAVRRELEQNAENGRERANLLQDALRELGGVPDVLSPAIGRVTAMLKATFEQVDAVEEALLQDLSLEHQLLDRARYLKALAESAAQPRVGKLAERLITAHTATVEWLTLVLAEEALGGPAALRATPMQRVSGGATRMFNLPLRVATEQVNRVVHNARVTGEQARSTLSSGAEKATQFTSVAREALAAGRSVSLHRAESLARRDGDSDTAREIHRARREAGALEPEELPVPDYDELNAQEAIRAIKELNTAADVRAILRYEENHANRVSVTNAATAQFARVAKEVATGAGPSAR